MEGFSPTSHTQVRRCRSVHRQTPFSPRRSTTLPTWFAARLPDRVSEQEGPEGRRREGDGSELTRALQAAQVEALGEVRPGESGRLMRPLLLISLFAGLVLFSLGRGASEPEPQGAQALPEPTGRVEGLRDFDELVRERALAASLDAGEAEASDAGVVEEAQPVSAASVVAPMEPPREVQPKRQRKEREPSGARGLVTLVTSPESDVFLGKRLIGRTPLIRHELPGGQQTLILVGPDGKRRKLSVKVSADAPQSFRMDLEAIPAL